ncbi:MAG TPA: hypothetical protein VM261_05515 [Kofleriaceae bacterium]|nr:hypothetical protein [Kofleriaceae bacterium]
MKRWHLVELEDLPWVPRVIRDGATDVLDWMFARLKMYLPVVDRLRATLDATAQQDIVDLCSGGAGGALAMSTYLRDRGDAGTRMTLTDRYPSASAIARINANANANARLRYHGEPVDALAVPRDLRGVRTMYSALHHFRPAEVKRLIAAAVADRAPIAFFDIAAAPALRRLPAPLVPFAMLFNFLMILVLVPFMVPFVRPFRASRLVFTYLIPLIPFLYAWDGTVSAVRAYTPEELDELARSVPGASHYLWESGRAGTGVRAVLYLTGRPA